MRQKRNSILYEPASSLKLHPEAQRRLSPTKLRKIVDNLDLDAIGTLHGVDYEIEGRFGPWIIDGQHRCTALLRHGLGEWKVNVEIHPCNDDRRAHELFLRFNDRATVPAYDKFLNNLGAEEASAVAASRVAARNDLVINYTPGDGHITCTATLQGICEKGGEELLQETLDVALTAWGHTASAVEGKVLSGLSRLLAKYNGEVEKDVLVKKLAKYPGGASGLLGDARGLNKLQQGSLAESMSQTILMTYNKGRRLRVGV